jgi:Zn finger protein HypA/HybF involved in hydrogenase expression
MNTYRIGEHQVVLIDGELYLKLSPEEAPIAEVITKPTRRAYLKRKVHVPNKRKSRTKLSHDDDLYIIQQFEAAHSISDIAKEMGVSYNTIAARHIKFTKGEKRGSPTEYKIKELNKAKKGVLYHSNEVLPEIERQMYECENGYQFKSNLLIDRVVCPICKSRDIDIFTEPPVHEEEVDA